MMAEWLRDLLVAAVVALAIALALAACATPPPHYACFPVETDRGPAMLCGPLKETPR